MKTLKSRDSENDHNEFVELRNISVQGQYSKTGQMWSRAYVDTYPSAYKVPYVRISRTLSHTTLSYVNTLPAAAQ